MERFRASVLVVGGSITRSWDLVAGPLEAGIRSRPAAATGLSVVPAEQPEQAPLIGAAWQVVLSSNVDGDTTHRRHDPGETLV